MLVKYFQTSITTSCLHKILDIDPQVQMASNQREHLASPSSDLSLLSALSLSLQLGGFERSCGEKSRLSDAALRVPGQAHGQSVGLRRQDPTEL